MDDSVDIGTGPIDLAVNESLQIQRATFGIESVAIEVEFQNVGGVDQFRRDGTRQEVPVGIPSVAGTDVSVGIHYTLGRQYAIRRHQVVQQLRIGRTRGVGLRGGSA